MCIRCTSKREGKEGEGSGGECMLGLGYQDLLCSALFGGFGGVVERHRGGIERVKEGRGRIDLCNHLRILEFCFVLVLVTH